MRCAALGPMLPSKEDGQAARLKRLFNFLVLSNICLYLEAGAVPAMLVRLSETFHMSKGQQGLLGGVVYLAISVGGPFAGYSFRKFHQKKVLGYSLIMNNVLLFCLAMAPDAWSFSSWLFIVLRGCLGLTQCFLCVYSPIWIDEFAPSGHRTSWMSASQAAVPIGIMSGYAMSSIAMWLAADAGGCGVLHCWRWPFVVQALLEVPFVVGFWMTPKELICVRNPQRRAGSASRSKSARSNGDGQWTDAFSSQSSLVSMDTGSAASSLQSTPASARRALRVRRAAREEQKNRCDDDEEASPQRAPGAEEGSLSLPPSRRRSQKPRGGRRNGDAFPSGATDGYDGDEEEGLRQLKQQQQQPPPQPQPWQSAFAMDPMRNVRAALQKARSWNPQRGAGAEGGEGDDVQDAVHLRMHMRQSSLNAALFSPHITAKPFAQYDRFPSTENLNSLANRVLLEETTDDESSFSFPNAKDNNLQRLARHAGAMAPLGNGGGAGGGAPPGLQDAAEEGLLPPPAPAHGAYGATQEFQVRSGRGIGFGEGAGPGPAASPGPQVSSSDRDTCNSEAVGGGRRSRRGSGCAEALSGEPYEEGSVRLVARRRKSQVWQLFSNPVYVMLVLCMSSLYFVVTGVQYWGTSYLLIALHGPQMQVNMLFIFTAATAPTAGVFFGGWLVDYFGGYRGLRQRVKALKLCLSLGCLSACAGVPATFTKSMYATVMLLWVLLFFGGSVLPACTGILVSIVPRRMRELSTATSLVVFNLLGYSMSLVLSGYVMEVIRWVAVAGAVECDDACVETWGFRVVLFWPSWSLLLLAGAIRLCTRKLRRRELAKGSKRRGEQQPLLGNADRDVVERARTLKDREIRL